ncbi:MAG: DUF1572 family protein [Bacteroidota bacterium]
MSDAATLAAARTRFAAVRDQAERALAQMDDAAFVARLGAVDPAATLVKHVAGNLRSRWTDPLTTDGNKPDRHRDQEFEMTEGDTREALMEAWADAWGCLEASMASFAPDDLDRTVRIRAEPMPLVAAILRSLAHTAGHVGQIVLLAKHFAGDDWQTLSIPRGESEAFAARMRARHAASEADSSSPS